MKHPFFVAFTGLIAILLSCVLLATLARAGELVGTVPSKLRKQAPSCVDNLNDPDTFSSLISVYTVRNELIAGGTMTFSIDEAPQLPLQVKLRADQEQGIALLDRLREGTAFVMFTRPGEGDPTDPERQAPRGAVLDYTVFIATAHPWGEECTFLAEASSVTEDAFNNLSPTLKSQVTGMNAANACGSSFIAQRFEPGSFFFKITHAVYKNKNITFNIENSHHMFNVSLNNPIDPAVVKNTMDSIARDLFYARMITSTPAGSATYDVNFTLYGILNPAQKWACDKLISDVLFQNVPAAGLPSQMAGPVTLQPPVPESKPTPAPAPSTSVCHAMIDDIRQNSIGQFAAAIPVEQRDDTTLSDVRGSGVTIPLTPEQAEAFTGNAQRAWYVYAFPNNDKVRDALANKTPQPMLASATGNLLVEMSPYECRQFTTQPVTLSQLPRTNLLSIWLLALTEKKTRSDNIDNLDAASYGNAVNLWQASLLEKLDEYLRFYY